MSSYTNKRQRTWYLRRGILWGLAVTLCVRVQGGPGNIVQSLHSAASSISSAVASLPDIKGADSAAYAAGAVGAACAAVLNWTQLPEQLLLAGPNLRCLSRMLSATSAFAVVVLLVLKVCLHGIANLPCVLCSCIVELTCVLRCCPNICYGDAQDASERGRLGASTFKSLNAGMAASSAGILMIMFRWSSTANLPLALVLHAALAAYLFTLTGYYRLTAKK